MSITTHKTDALAQALALEIALRVRCGLIASDTPVRDHLNYLLAQPVPGTRLMADAVQAHRAAHGRDGIIALATAINAALERTQPKQAQARDPRITDAQQVEFDVEAEIDMLYGPRG